MTHFLSCQPDAPDGRRWLVLSVADVAPGPGGGPVLLTESSHVKLSEAAEAVTLANAAAERRLSADLEAQARKA